MWREKEREKEREKGMVGRVATRASAVCVCDCPDLLVGAIAGVARPSRVHHAWTHEGLGGERGAEDGVAVCGRKCPRLARV